MKTFHGNQAIADKDFILQHSQSNSSQTERDDIINSKKKSE